MIPFILSGGSGTRLWPVSRVEFPKPLAPLFEKSLLHQTIERLGALGPVQIISAQGSKVLTDKLLKQNFQSVEATYEPFARNTAAAVALACLKLARQGKVDEITGIFPADHLIQNQERFVHAMSVAEAAAREGFVATIGIQPAFPATGYGYIEVRENAVAAEGDLRALSVERFREKPHRDLAETFVASGKHFWNAGMFVFQVRTMIQHFEAFQPELWSKLQELKADESNFDQIYSELPSISIDYAIMEQLGPTQIACVPADLDWSDVGSWDAIADLDKSDNPDLHAIDCENIFVKGLPGKRYATTDIQNLIIVDTKDALFVTQRGHSEKVKQIVEALANSPETKEATLSHPFEYRPWGRYEVLMETETFKSKVIHVEPGHRLSYQSHEKREEHWLFTRGEAEVTLDGEIYRTTAGSYIHIPMGAKHRVANTGDTLVEFIEVQLGSYFGEDDIQRYQDDYQRGS